MIKRKWKQRLVIALLILPIVYIAWAHISITKAAKQQPDQEIPYMIILGAGLRGETMSLSLLYRMETALHYLQNNPQTIAIVSGGQGHGESITEASAMHKYLIEHGIAQKRVLLENRATTTVENIQFSKPLLPEGRVLIVTNDFHAYRATMLAQRHGLVVQTLSAPTPRVVQTKLLLREYAAIIKSLMLDW